MDRKSVSSVSVLMIMSILLLSGGLAIATHIDCYKTCMKICPFQRKRCEKLCTESCHRAAAAAVADHRYYCKLGCSLEKCTKFGRGIYIFIYLSILYCLFLSLSDSFWFAICNGVCMLFSCGMQICRKWEAARMSAQTSIAMSRLSSNSLSYHHCFMWRWPKLLCLIFILIQ